MLEVREMGMKLELGISCHDTHTGIDLEHLELYPVTTIQEKVTLLIGSIGLMYAFLDVGNRCMHFSM